MNIKVMYHSQTGNTRRLAESVAQAVGAAAEQIPGNGIKEPVDLLFIGDGVYGGRPNASTEQFIRSLNGELVKNAAVFGTFGGMRKAIDLMKEQLRQQGVNVVDECFGCKGRSWGVFNRSHPDEQDLKAAKDFAKGVTARLK